MAKLGPFSPADSGVIVVTIGVDGLLSLSPLMVMMDVWPGWHVIDKCKLK